jgi:hypothetical protein
MHQVSGTYFRVAWSSLLSSLDLRHLDFNRKQTVLPDYHQVVRETRRGILSLICDQLFIGLALEIFPSLKLAADLDLLDFSLNRVVLSRNSLHWRYVFLIIGIQTQPCVLYLHWKYLAISWRLSL